MTNICIQKKIQIFLLGALTTACSAAHTPLELLDLVENKSKTTHQIKNDFFDELIRQLTQKNAETTFLFNSSWKSNELERVINATTSLIKENPQTLQKYLQFFSTMQPRTDYNPHVALTITYEILEKLLNDQTCGKQAANFVAKNLNTMDQEWIKVFLEKYQNVADNLVNSLTTKKLKKTPYWLTKLIFKNAKGTTKIKLAGMLKTLKPKGGLFRNFIKQKAGYFALKKFPEAFPEQAKAITKSEKHLKLHKKNIKQNYLKDIQNNKTVRKAFKALHKKEKEEQAKGHYTFVHAQKWQWHFFADIFKKLWEINYNETVTNYQFLRFEKRPTNMSGEKTKRKKALKNRDSYNWHNRATDSSAGRLFMNHAIFGNSGTFHGNSSAWHWLNNNDYSNLWFDVGNLFIEFDLENLYIKYAERLEALQEIHRASSTKIGNMLLISLPPEQLKESVILSNIYGQKIPAQIDGNQTGDITRIMETLKDDPSKVQTNGTFSGLGPDQQDSDGLQYCLILTHDLALDPHNGPRIYSFNAPDKKKFAEYEKMRDEIFAEIAQDVASGNFEKKKISSPEEKSAIKKTKITAPLLFKGAIMATVAGAITLLYLSGK